MSKHEWVQCVFFMMIFISIVLYPLTPWTLVGLMGGMLGSGIIGFIYDGIGH